MKQAYGVAHDNLMVWWYVSGTGIPMTWDVARRMAVHMRLACRRVMEWTNQSRELIRTEEGSGRKGPNRTLPVMVGNEWSVQAEQDKVVVRVPRGRIAMGLEEGNQVAQWLDNSGRELQQIVAPHLDFSYHIGDLTFEHEHDELAQSRRVVTI